MRQAALKSDRLIFGSAQTFEDNDISTFFVVDRIARPLQPGDFADPGDRRGALPEINQKSKRFVRVVTVGIDAKWFAHESNLLFLVASSICFHHDPKMFVIAQPAG